MTNAIAPATAVLDAAPPSRPKNAESAAKEFEAVLIGQMMRSVREAAEDEDGDSTSEPMIDLADQQFSRMLAGNGGLGLAKTITTGLKQGEQNAHQR
jgi:Rod binding domain-containing protein